VARTINAREMMFGFRDEFTYFECAQCGCVQIQDIPVDLGKYYPHNYYSFQRDGFIKRLLKEQLAVYSYGGSSMLGRLMAVALGKNLAIESVKRSGVGFNTPILDVGCGSGDLLLLLRSLGFTNLTGVDPFVEKDIIYPNGVRIFKKNLGDMSGPFGLIMLHHAFEHVIDPVDITAQAARILTKGGQFLVRIPVAGTLAWKHYGAKWVQLDPPRHIILPTIKSMAMLAGRTGLRLGDVVFDSNEFQFWGSEQYLNDIPMHDPRSLLPLSKRMRLFMTMKRQRQKAEELNAKKDGDQACFHFYKDL
jgi:SAM-dependent methyltransferase